MNTLDYIVNKYNIEVGSQYIVDIPGIGREDLAKLFAELKFTKGAEIGVEKGAYSESLCKWNPDLELYCIDPWSAGAYEPNIFGIDEEQNKYDERYLETVKR